MRRKLRDGTSIRPGLAQHVGPAAKLFDTALAFNTVSPRSSVPTRVLVQYLPLTSSPKLATRRSAATSGKARTTKAAQTKYCALELRGAGVVGESPHDGAASAGRRNTGVKQTVTQGEPARREFSLMFKKKKVKEINSTLVWQTMR